MLRYFHPTCTRYFYTINTKQFQSLRWFAFNAKSKYCEEKIELSFLQNDRLSQEKIVNWHKENGCDNLITVLNQMYLSMQGS